MPDFVPQLSNEVEFHLGDKFNNEVDNRMFWLLTFIKSNVAVTANRLGFYLKRQVGNVAELDLKLNITVHDPFWTIEPETPMPPWESGPGTATTLASNVDLPGLIGQAPGWKTIDITPFTFDANRTYTIMFEVASQNIIENRQDDGFVISAAQKFNIPIVPPDIPFPENQRQAKNAYGRERLEFGWVYTFPVAVALYGEAAPPPPVEKGMITSVSAPTNALEGEEVPITATIKNIGEIATSFSVYFFKPGHGIYRGAVLEPGQSATVSVTYTMPAEDMPVSINLTHADVVDDTRTLTVYLGVVPPPPLVRDIRSALALGIGAALGLPGLG